MAATCRGRLDGIKQIDGRGLQFIIYVLLRCIASLCLVAAKASWPMLCFYINFVQDPAARSLFSTKSDPTKRGDGFNMGDRDSILDGVEAGPILVHVALAEGNQFPYEAIMRSVFKHLMDSATSEYLFTIEFFKVGSGFALLEVIIIAICQRHPCQTPTLAKCFLRTNHDYVLFLV